MEEIRTIEEVLLETIKTLDDDAIVNLWNEYCLEGSGSVDDYINRMEDFNDLYSSVDPLEVATRVFYGCDENREGSSFNPNREYFYFNGYGNPVSIDYIYNSYSEKFYGPVDIDCLIDYIVEEREGFGIGEIEEVIESFEEE